jgi:hypothetical protein
MTTENQRRHKRLKHQADIRVRSDEDTVYTFQMYDSSESGIYLLCDDTSIVEIGDKVTLKTLEFDGAPILDARVLRVEADRGFAVQFLDQ